MRKLLFAIGLFLSLAASAQVQWTPTGSRTRFGSGIAFSTKDTLVYNQPGDSLVLIMGQDSALKYKYKGNFKNLATTSDLASYKAKSDTGFNGGYTTRERNKQGNDSLGSVITSGLALKLNISDTSGMLTAYKNAIIALNDDTATLQTRFTNVINLANSKQSALSGTGFVKISGTTISYDNSTYLTGINASLVNAVGTISNNTTGNAATATLAANSTLWDGVALYPGSYSSGTISKILAYNSTNSRTEFMSNTDIQTFLGLGSYAYRSSGLAELSGATFTGQIQPSYQNTINTTTPGTQTYGLHFVGQTTADYANGITWNGASSGAQAGIYVQGSGSYGTKMYLATTDNFTTGAKTAISIDQSGNVVLTRGSLTGTNASFSNDITAYSVGLNGSVGGWARHYSFIGSTGTNRGGFGAFGADNALSYYYIGNAYNDNKLQIDATTGVAYFSSTLSATTGIFSGGLQLTGGTLPTVSGSTLTYAYASANHDFAFGDGTGYSYRLVKRVGGVTTPLFTLTDAGVGTIYSGLNVGGLLDVTSSVYSRAVEYLRSFASTTGAAQYQSWYNVAGTRRGYFGFGSTNDPTIALVNENTNGSIVINANGSGIVYLSSLSTTTASFGGLATFSSGTIVPNGQYYRANRTTGGASINLLGIESGTDNTVMVASNFFKLRNTGTGDAANLFTVSSIGDAVVTGAITASNLYAASSGQIYLTSGDLRFSSNAGFGIVSADGNRQLAVTNGNITINNAFTVSGTTTFSSLAGTGDRMVVANSSGVLSTQAIPSAGTSGTYTPTVTNLSNTTGSTGGITAHYIRIGNEVTVYFSAIRSATSANTYSAITLDLPVSSNLSGAYSLWGNATVEQGSQSYTAALITKSSTSAGVVFYPPLSGTFSIYGSFTYIVN